MTRFLITTMFSVLCLATSVTPGHTSMPAMKEGQLLEKMYIQPEQISVTAEGIFFFSQEGVPIPVQWMAHDAEGLYIVAARYQCPACRRWNHDNMW